MFNLEVNCPCSQSETIQQYLIAPLQQIHFPVIGNLVDQILGCYLGSGKLRFGPLPNPERQNRMRKVIETAVMHQEPIPVLVGWGSCKLASYDLDGVLDVSEIEALRQITFLKERIQGIYPPGIEVRIRVEDTGALWLFGEKFRPAINAYAQQFGQLIEILGLRSFIAPVNESGLMQENEYFVLSQKLTDLFLSYLQTSDLFGIEDPSSQEVFKGLLQVGWTGVIPLEQRNYYRGLYEHLYPSETGILHTIRMAKYFAGALARYILDGVGIKPEWKESGYLKLAFTPPVPGSPMGQTEVTYRVSLSSRNQIPPWRGIGFIKVTESGPQAKVASIREPLNLMSVTSLLQRGQNILPLHTDCLIS